jgi:iron(III) transport system substrate-binding protein
MTMQARISRRAALAGAATVFAAARAGAQSAVHKVTPELIEAAKKEGKVSHYTSDDLTIATKVAKQFEAKYGITFQLERSGAERNYQRISQEMASNIHAVDVITSSDLSYIAAWKKAGITAAYDVAETQDWPADARDPDGFYALQFFTLMAPCYNTRMIKPEEAPKSWADLLDPKWKGKIVKAHPGYSGTIMTGTFALSRALGWEYFEKLGKQGIMQVQSAVDPPLRVAQGERPIAADSSENSTTRAIEQGAPVKIFYPPEGVPVVPIGVSVMAKAPRPNAARLLKHFLLTPEIQQFYVDGGARSFSPTSKAPESRTPTSQIKLLYADPEQVAKEAEDIRKRYARYFGI